LNLEPGWKRSGLTPPATLGKLGGYRHLELPWERLVRKLLLVLVTLELVSCAPHSAAPHRLGEAGRAAVRHGPPAAPADPRTTLRVHFIDVGQADAVLLEFPCAAMLVDLGAEKNRPPARRPSNGPPGAPAEAGLLRSPRRTGASPRPPARAAWPGCTARCGPRTAP